MAGRHAREARAWHPEKSNWILEMRDDELKQLLTRAETDLPAHSPVASDTVRAVHRRFTARQRRRRLATGVSCLALVFALGWQFVPTHDTRQSPTDQVA